MLYNLPVVLKADVVFIAEGEKDCGTLSALHLERYPGFEGRTVAATTNSGGAGKWESSYGELLKGKDAFVFEDNDEPGRKHAQTVLTSVHPHARSVKLISLPGLPEHGDVSDWMRVHSVEELLAEIQRALQWHPEPKAPASNGTAEEPGPEAAALPRLTADEAATLTSELLETCLQWIRRYVVLPEHAYLPVTMWCVATHAADRFDCFPYLALLSPAKRCGKTRLLEVLETLVHLPWRGAAPTPAALFRMMAERPTLLLDEVEVLNGKNKSESAQAILAILNAGHRKGAAIPRCDGAKHELKHFAVYGPKAFAAIRRLPDTLTDRSIVITMQRRSAEQKVARFLTARASAEAKPLREAVASFARANQGVITRAYARLIDADLGFLGGRDADLWIPLFAVCSVAAPERVADLKQSAVALSTAKAGEDADDSLPVKLLADIRTVWHEAQEKCDTATLIDRLKALEESPWSEHELSPRKLARLLKPLGVDSRGVRIGDKTPKGYEYKSLVSAFSRYLEDLSATSATSQ